MIYVKLQLHLNLSAEHEKRQGKGEDMAKFGEY